MGKLRGVKHYPLLFLLALPLGGMLVIWMNFYGKVTPLSVAQSLTNQSAGEIRGNFTVGQTFYSPYPGLCRIDVMLATYARHNSGQVTFNLTAGPKEQTKLVTISFDADQVEDNRFRSFEFSPQDNSAGKSYYFYLEAPGSSAGNAITVWTHSANPYGEGVGYLGGRQVESDLTFVAYFRPNPWQLADIYFNRLARGKPAIWGTRQFYAVSFFLYFALVGIFFALLVRKAIRMDE